MNAPVTFAHPTATVWPQIYDGANAFRGVMLHHYTGMEAAISETLMLLRKAGRCGPLQPLHLAGQRRAELRSALLSMTDDSAIATHALRTLDELEHYLPMRVMLCHGQAIVTLDGNSKWCLCLENITFDGDNGTREWLVIRQKQAETLLTALRSCHSRVNGALAAVHQAVLEEQASIASAGSQS